MIQRRLADTRVLLSDPSTSMPMPSFLILAALFALTAPAIARAQDFATICHASSSYDLTLSPDSMLLDRAAPAPRRIEWRAGRVSVDGTLLHPSAEDSDRLALFEQELRALVPKAKAVANRGVELAIKAVHAEAASLGADTDTLEAIDTRLAARGAELRRRIADSHSTHDWQGDALDQYFTQVAADIVPLLAADLTHQAVAVALSGDLDAAATLRDRAATLGGADLRARLQQRMQPLRAQIAALCPAIRQLYDTQRGVRGNHGRPLDLLQIDAK
jgi:hypothetical protein